MQDRAAARLTGNKKGKREGGEKGGVVPEMLQ